MPGRGSFTGHHYKNRHRREINGDECRHFSRSIFCPVTSWFTLFKTHTYASLNPTDGPLMVCQREKTKCCLYRMISAQADTSRIWCSGRGRDRIRRIQDRVYQPDESCFLTSLFAWNVAGKISVHSFRETAADSSLFDFSCIMVAIEHRMWFPEVTALTRWLFNRYKRCRYIHVRVQY